MRRRRRAETGSDEEFVSFVRESQRRLRRLAFLVCGDWHRAEDIVQTALAQVYVHWARIRNEIGPEPYARRAVVNAAIDESRRPWRRERAVPDIANNAAGAEERMDDVIVEALLALSPRQRAVVVLRYVEDLDITKTADLLGISNGTVKSQAARGLATLRERLSRHAVDAGRGGSR